MARADGETQDKDTITYKIRHSMAHILAQAVQGMFKEVKLGFGPPTETGFYYDFDFGTEEIEEKSLKKIEKRMRQILNKDQHFERVDLGFDDTLEKSKELKEPLKEQHIQNLKDRGVQEFGFYKNGPFIDLCEGPHVESTKDLKNIGFKLDRIAGAYWLGNEKNKTLTRIYALCYETQDELDEFIERRKLAAERDHKKLGRELDLYTIDETVGKGLILWMPNGTVIRDQIEDYAKEVEFKCGYKRVSTPHITKEDLFLKSQHLPHYKDSMFPPMQVEDDDGIKETFYLKPMNCPFHHTIFSSRPKSYRDLPLRFAEYGTCYRFEQSGELSGLIRVRCMTMNDAHIYCHEEGLNDEIKSIMSMYQDFYSTFGLTDYTYRLSIRGEEERSKFKGDEALWDRAESILENVLNELELPFYIGEGEAAFYGPKIDIQFKNILGREETVSTVQVDFLGPINFDLKYIDNEGHEKRPVIIHRAPLSTHERFLSFLIEYYGGAFPVWMTPVQVVIIPVGPAFVDYAKKIEQEMFHLKFRVEVDDSDNSFSKKIRTHTKRKIPILLIVGEKEQESESVTVRRYKVKEQETLGFKNFINGLSTEVSDRKLLPSFAAL